MVIDVKNFDITKTKAYKELTPTQRKCAEKAIEAEVMGIAKPKCQIYKEVKPDCTEMTARVNGSKTFTNTNVISVIDEARSQILHYYGWKQFTDKLTDLTHSSPDQKVQMLASVNMLKVMGLFEKKTKNVNLNINLSSDDLRELRNLTQKNT